MQHTIIKHVGLDVGYHQYKVCWTDPGSGGKQILILPSIAPVVPASKAQQGTDGNSMEVDKGFYVALEHQVRYVGEDATTKLRPFETAITEVNYCLTPVYRALHVGGLAHVARACGAPESMNIEVMVVGLPAGSHGEYKDRLIKQTQGTHTVPAPGGREVRVTIDKVYCLAQPQGVLVKASAIDGADALIIDQGGGTLDWLPVIEGKCAENGQGSTRLGMLRAAHGGLRAMGVDPHQNHRLVTRFSAALCAPGEFAFSLSGTPVSRARAQLAFEAASEVGATGLRIIHASVEDFSNFQYLVFSGGGANFLSKVFKARYPQHAHRVILDDTPITTVVEGFWMWAKHMHHVGQAQTQGAEQ